MFLQFYKPHRLLQDFVSRIMLARYCFDQESQPPTNPFPPQPEHCLYFYPYDKVFSYNYATASYATLPSSILVGPQLSRVDLRMGHNTLIIYVGFHPGGLHRLLHIPMHQMIDQAFDATLVLGKEIGMLTEHLNQSNDYNQMIALVQQYLLQKMEKIKSALPIEEVLKGLVNYEHALSIDGLSHHACVSVRQLERQFKERIGMSPKTYFRLIRFSKAWRMREGNPHISWIKIAYSCGYADQMHMIRDFKEFAGATPTVLQNDLQKTTLRLQAELTSDFPF